MSCQPCGMSTCKGICHAVDELEAQVAALREERDEAIRRRDVEWVKMLGCYDVAGGNGNTPEVMAREMEGDDYRNEQALQASEERVKVLEGALRDLYNIPSRADDRLMLVTVFRIVERVLYPSKQSDRKYYCSVCANTVGPDSLCATEAPEGECGRYFGSARRALSPAQEEK